MLGRGELHLQEIIIIGRRTVREDGACHTTLGVGCCSRARATGEGACWDGWHSGRRANGWQHGGGGDLCGFRHAHAWRRVLFIGTQFSILYTYIKNIKLCRIPRLTRRLSGTTHLTRPCWVSRNDDVFYLFLQKQKITFAQNRVYIAVFAVSMRSFASSPTCSSVCRFYGPQEE